MLPLWFLIGTSQLEHNPHESQLACFSHINSSDNHKIMISLTRPSRQGSPFWSLLRAPPPGVVVVEGGIIEEHMTKLVGPINSEPQTAIPDSYASKGCTLIETKEILAYPAVHIQIPSQPLTNLEPEHPTAFKAEL